MKGKQFSLSEVSINLLFSSSLNKKNNGGVLGRLKCLVTLFWVKAKEEEEEKKKKKKKTQQQTVDEFFDWFYEKSNEEIGL